MRGTGGYLAVEMLTVKQMIETACTPSQKLKEKNKEKFYEIKAAIVVDENQNFKKFLLHPYTSCDCPVGCITCAHIGGFVLLLNVMKNFDIGQDNLPTTFEMMRSMFPPPVNDVLTRPMYLGYAFPKNNTQEKESSNIYNNERKSKRRNSLMNEVPLNDQNEVEVSEEEDVLEEETFGTHIIEYAFGEIIEASITPTIPVVEESLKWLEDIKLGRGTNGALLKTGDSIDTAFASEAARKSSSLFKMKQLKILDILENDLLPKFHFDSDESVCGIDKIVKRHPEPIIAPVLKASAEKRQTLLQEFANSFDISKIPLDIVSSDNNEDDLLRTTNID